MSKLVKESLLNRDSTKGGQGTEKFALKLKRREEEEEEEEEEQKAL
jgi:hypothetical protein